MIQISKNLGGGGVMFQSFTEGGEMSPTFDLTCNDGGHDGDTNTTDCIVSKGPASTQVSVSHKGKMRLIRAGSCMSKSFWARL